MSRRDYRYIYAAAEKVGFTHLMPPIESSICCIVPLRRAMPGLFSFSLPILFYMMDPKSRLALDAHEDTLMLFIVKLIFALMYFGRKDESLPNWEKYLSRTTNLLPLFTSLYITALDDAP